MKHFKIILPFLVATYLTSCCCEEDALSKDVFGTKQNDYYNGQFDIDGVYMSVSKGSAHFIIFYNDGIVFYPDAQTHLDFYNKLSVEDMNICDINFLNDESDKYYWSYYRVENNRIFIESLVDREYPCADWRTNTTKVIILDNSTLEIVVTEDYSKLYKLAKCYDKPDSIDYWRDK